MGKTEPHERRVFAPPPLQPRRWFGREDITSYSTSLLYGKPKKKPDPNYLARGDTCLSVKRLKKNLDHCHSSWTYTKLSSSKHTINLAYGLSHLPLWELPGHLLPGRITSIRSWCHFLPNATLVTWLTKERTVLAELAASQKFHHLQGIFLCFHYYSFPLQILLLDIRCSAQMHCFCAGVGPAQAI